MDYPKLTPDLIRRIDFRDCPLVVLTDCVSSWVSRLIIWHSNLRKHEKHNYSHAMIMVRPGWVASQDHVFRNVPVDKYLSGNYRVKFWYRPDWGIEQKAKITTRVGRALNASVLERRYDALGIVGQWLDSLTGFGRFVNRPDRYYCSERVLSHLPEEPILLTHPSPADLDRYFTRSPHWAVYGVYDPRAAHE